MTQPADQPAAPPRALTVRAVLTALLLAVVVVLLVQHHDGNVARRNVVSQTYIAPVVIGVVFAFLFLNALLRSTRRTLGLSGGELAVVLTLLVMTAPIMRYYAHNWVGTAGHTPGLLYTESLALGTMKKANVYSVLPPQATLQVNDSLAYLGAATDEPGSLASPAKIPWGKWAGALAFFAPLMGLFLIVSICLAMVYYRQWAHRELAPFPIAEFGAMLVDSRQNRALPDIFYNRLFWIGVGLMIFIFGVNGLHAHFEKMIEVPTKFAYYELAKSFPFLNKSREGYSLLRGGFYFTMVAVAVLLPSEISFTSWVTWPIMVVATFFFYQRTGQSLNSQQNSMILAGGHVAMLILILYAGRTFYVALLRRAACLPTRESVDHQSIWSMRLLVVATMGLALIMYRHGLPPDIIAMWIGLAFMYLTITCRLVAEMGIGWLPLGDLAPLSLILMLTGVKTMGIKTYALLAIMQSHLIPSRVSTLPIAPAVMNGARIEDKITGRSTAALTVGPATVVVLLLSAAALIWLGYSVEGEPEDLFAPTGIPEVKDASGRIFALAENGNVNALLNDGRPAIWTGASGGAGDVWSRRLTDVRQRWSAVQITPGFTGFFLFGFALVMLTGVARLKFPRFPLHPLPLILLGTWLMSRFVFSFFVGWLIKKALIKIGGGKLFEQSRPFFVGIVVGQAAIATVWVLANIAIFWEQRHSFMNTWYYFMMDMYSS